MARLHFTAAALALRASHCRESAAAAAVCKRRSADDGRQTKARESEY